MDKEIGKEFAEKNETLSISKNETPEEDMIRTDISKARNISSDSSSMKTVSFSSTIAMNGSNECLDTKNIMPEPVVKETDSSEKLGPVLEFTESDTEIDRLQESIIMQTEETEEMLEMVTREKQKLEFYISLVEKLVKSLQELTNVYSKIRNTYLKKIYRKKLEEFASGLLEKTKNSIKDLEAAYENLKKHEKKADETFEKFLEFRSISDPCTSKIGNQSVGQLKETVDDLTKEMCLMKPKQLWEIKKVSYIETDIEMLRDLLDRFLSTEGFSIIGF